MSNPAAQRGSPTSQRGRAPSPTGQQQISPQPQDPSLAQQQQAEAGQAQAEQQEAAAAQDLQQPGQVGASQAAQAPPDQSVVTHAGGATAGGLRPPSTGTPSGTISTSKHEAAEVDQFMQGLSGFIEAISFDGMDPVYIRRLARNQIADWKSLVQAIIMYVHWGSRFYRKDKRSKDEAESAKAIAALKQLGVVEDKKEGKLTLARLAASHPVLLYAVRDYLFKSRKLPTTGVNVPDLYPPMADLGLACYSDRNTDQMKLYRTFLERFAIQLHDAAVDEKRTIKKEDEEVIKEMNKFRTAATASLQNDVINDVQLSGVTITEALSLYGYATN